MEIIESIMEQLTLFFKVSSLLIYKFQYLLILQCIVLGCAQVLGLFFFASNTLCLKCMWSMRSDTMPLVSNLFVVGRGDMKKEILLSDFSAIPFILYEVQRHLLQTAIKMKYNSRQM